MASSVPSRARLWRWVSSAAGMGFTPLISLAACGDGGGPGVRDQYVLAGSTISDQLSGNVWSVPPARAMTWNEANAHCDELGDGWRMPGAGELEALLSDLSFFKAGNLAALSGIVFWTATSNSLNADFAQICGDPQSAIRGFSDLYPECECGSSVRVQDPYYDCPCPAKTSNAYECTDGSYMVEAPLRVVCVR